MNPQIFFTTSAYPVALGVLQYGSDMGPVLKQLPRTFSLNLKNKEVCMGTSLDLALFKTLKTLHITHHTEITITITHYTSH